MALIEVFHVIASEFSIDATNTTDIPQGRLVGLSAAGQIGLSDDDATPALEVIGLAADSRSQGTTSYTAESGSALSRNPGTSLTGALVVGALGAGQRFTQNRVADNFNEVLASGKMTVYHSGGEFWTSEFELTHSNGTTVATYVPGDALYPSGSSETAGTDAGEFVAVGGRFTDEGATNLTTVVARVLTAPTQYPSGVPGVDTGFNSLPEGGNSITFGSFLHIKLLV